MSIGNRVLKRQRQVNASVVEAFAALPVAVVSDSMSRVFAGGSDLRPMHRDGSMAGVALTVRTRPGDNLMLHKAIDMAEPGDVIVCDAGGDTTNALMGELMLAYAVKKGVVGFVLNGAIRDLDGFRETNLPTFAAGVTHRGPYKNGPGEINTAISLNGMVIEPGDLIIGDSDGMLCVPYDDADAVLKAAQAKQAAEEKQMAAIHAGENDRSWVDAALKSTGFEFA
ncbi:MULTISPECIES: RraA family protein [Kushneria]|uniref:Putative 4-hydroxy-4-methyl-2-oxoglutarate aldolase n=2 Tax=Kushneria TaxID=504090 RepID=A0A240UK85_9GAMM|nr:MULTISPECIES: RraA family protein [Kushneria]ARS53763.1 methyltransferase [Kushneria konosiri]ART61888.1 methyltransferase [Kushneria marisflavi]RKD86934.1 regulator of RNase E activity RraA [Kushneria marisflavi]